MNLFGRTPKPTPTRNQQATAAGLESLAAGYRQEAAETDHPGERALCQRKAGRLTQQAKDIRSGRDTGLC